MNKVYTKWWFWVIIVVVVLGVIGAVGTNSKDKTNNDTPNDSVVTSVDSSVSSNTNENTSVEDNSSEPSTEKTTYGVGDTATAKSYKLTVEECKTIESDNQFAQPEEGKEFVEVVILIENTSDEELHISSALNFDAYEDGFAITESMNAMVASTNESLGGTVGSGKKLKGSLCYEVSEGWSEIEITADIGYSADDEITLLIKK